MPPAGAKVMAKKGYDAYEIVHMVKLLQINVDVNNGSNGSIVRDIAKMAIERGWDSYIAYGRRMIPTDSTLIRIGNNIDVKFHGLITRLFDLHGLGSFFVTKRFIRYLKQNKPDIIHLHNIHGYYINYKVLFDYIYKEQIPVVWTLHDCWPFTGHCGHYIGYNCYKWKDECGKCPARKDYPASLMLDNSKFSFRLKKRLFTKLDKVEIVTVSNWLKSETEQSFLSKYPIRVIYDGIDTECFVFRDSDLRKKYNIQGKFVLISAAANWSDAKGWNDYIKLSQLVSNDYVIVLIGVNEEQKQNLPPNILSIPRIESKLELAEYYSMADVLLNLSYAETFGMTTAEAMACGTPGISYDITACPELITKETGIVVEPGNLNEVIRAIEEIKRKGKKSYSNACRQRVLDNYDFKEVNKQYFDIYESFLRQK